MEWQRAVIELHEFFEAWIRGLCDRAALTELEQALAGDFSMIVPSGALITRSEVIDRIGASHGSHPGLTIRVDGFSTLVVADPIVVGRYIEHHDGAGAATTLRVATAVLRHVGDRGPLQWVTVHETWQAAP
jgi:hypothetical protein